MLKIMKTSRFSIFLFLVTVVVSVAYAAAPPMNVTISDSSGKAAYKGATDAKGTFATAALKPGNYTVQFSSKSTVKGSTYALVVSAGNKKVTASSVPAEKFASGGVAMKIDVGAGLGITGQVAGGAKTKLDSNGKEMVWIPQKLGSNLPAHWAPADSAEAKEAKTQGSYSTKNIQDKQNAGISPGG
jgi:hypothetical protein